MSDLRVNFSYPIAVFDTETGGLEPEPIIDWNLDVDVSKSGQLVQGVVKTPAAPILELAAVMLDPVSLEEISSFHTYCGPNKGETVEQLLQRCNPEALAVNGFDSGERKKALSSAPPLEEALQNWINWLRAGTDSHGRYPKKFIPCGQNVRFDINMLNSSFRREGIDFQLKSQPLELIGFSMLYFGLPNTGSVARYSLEVVAQALGISIDDAHTALADVRMTAKCLKTFVKAFTSGV